MPAAWLHIAVELIRHELLRRVGVRIEAVVQSLAGDLGDPGVVVTLAEDAVGVQGIGEIGIDIGVRGGGHGPAPGDAAVSAQNRSLHEPVS